MIKDSFSIYRKDDQMVQMMKSPTLLLCCICLTFITAFYFGCSPEDEGRSPAVSAIVDNNAIDYGGVYTIPLKFSPITLDPAFIEDDYGISVSYQLFDGLVQFGPYLSILPALAKNWEVEGEGKIIKFYLRTDAHFHHGKRVSTEDVVFSISRLIKLEPAPSILPHLLKIKGAQEFRDGNSSTIAGLVIIDDNQFEIHLLEPYAPLLSALAMYQAAIVPKDATSQLQSDFGKAPIGSGPFKFREWQPDEIIRLEKNPEYYAGRPYLDAVEYHIYPGAQRDQVLSDFRNGQLHEMDVYGKVREQLADVSGLNWIHRPSLSLLFYGVNVNHPTLANPELRRALALSIDRAALVREVYEGQFDPAYSILPPGMPTYNSEEQAIVEDLVEAKSIVEKIRQRNGGNRIKVEIVSASQSAFAKAEFRFIQNQWANIGIETEIKYITDWAAFEKYLNSDAMQIYRYVWTADMPDPDNFLQPLLAKGSSVNYTGYTNPEIELLLKQASGMVDKVQRARTYQLIEKKAMEAFPLIPMFYLSIDRVYHSQVKGISSSPLGWQAVRLHRFWLESTPQ